MITPAALVQGIQEFPAVARPKLEEILLAGDFCGHISATGAKTLTQQLNVTIEQLMLDLRALARLYAMPLISNYHVGTISRGLSGNLYFGANLEFAGQPLNQTIHGEQSAIMNGWLHGETGILALAVGGSPCGHCRQVMAELATASQLKIVTPTRPPEPLALLLPHAFGPHSLGHKDGLMQPQNHRLQLTTPSDDPTTLAALEMANISYAPYSKGYAGVALLTENNQIFAGPYAENAAFNPSLSPLQAALNKINLCGQSFEQIVKAVLVETKESSSSQIQTTQSVLTAVAGQAELRLAYAQ